MAIGVCLTVDNFGLAADVGRGLASGPDSGEPGLATGLPAIVDLLARFGVHATFFVEGWNGVHHGDRLRDLTERGHEVGCHGWVHEAWAELDDRTEFELLVRSVDALRSSGVEVDGFRAPGGYRAPSTLTVLRSLGLSYDASLDAGGCRLDPTGVAVVPFDWEHVDWYWFGRREPPAPAAEFAAALRSGLAAADADHPLVVVLHPRTSGLYPERLEVVASLLDEVMNDNRFEVTTVREAAARVATPF